MPLDRRSASQSRLKAELHQGGDVRPPGRIQLLEPPLFDLDTAGHPKTRPELEYTPHAHVMLCSAANKITTRLCHAVGQLERVRSGQPIRAPRLNTLAFSTYGIAQEL